MASIRDLPPELLTRIFGAFRPFEWLLLETVCQRWRDVIAIQLWSRLRRVDEEGIGFPSSDFRRNFIEIAQRIRSVKRFISPLRLASCRMSSLETDEQAKLPITDQLKAAMGELVRKRSADAVFPLDLIKDVCSGVRGVLLASMHLKEYHAAEFSAIRLDKVILHQKIPDENPLLVFSYGDNDVPLRLEKGAISRIVIGILVIQLSMYVSDMQEAVSEMAAWKTCFASFPNLDKVEIESIELVIPPRVIEQLRGISIYPLNEPLLSMRVRLAEGACVLALAEFKALLERLSPTYGDSWNDDCLDMIRKWKRDGAVKGVAMQIHSDKFMLIEGMSWDYRGLDVDSDDESMVGDEESVKCIVAELFPELVDKLHLTVLTTYEGGDYFARLLRDRAVLGRVKEYTVAYVLPIRSWMDGSREHDSKAFLSEAYNFIRLVCDDMTRLEVLRINLKEGGRLCAFPKMNNVPIVKQPLPSLQLVEIDGYPCFPFLSSIVQHAVNLKQLIINCQPFSSDHTGVQRVNQFLESMHECRSLTHFSLKAWSRQDRMFMGTDRMRRRPRSDKFEDKLRPMVAEMKSHLDRLANSMPNLLFMAVIIARCDFKYEVDRRGH